MKTSKKTINAAMVVGIDTHCEKLVWNMIHKPENVKQISQSLVIEEGYKQTMKAARRMFHEKNIVDIEYDDALPYDAQCVHTYDLLDDKSKYEYLGRPVFATKDCICRPLYVRNYGKGHLGLFAIHMSKEGEYDDEGRPKGKKAAKFMEDIAKLSYQKYVVEELGYHVDKCTLYFVNGEYTKGDRHIWADFFVSEDVTQMVEEYGFRTKLAIEKVKNLMTLENEPECPGIDPERCINLECPCKDRCIEEKHATDSIVWKIARLYKTKKCLLVNNGVTTPEQVAKAHNDAFVVLNDKQRRQVEYAITPNKAPHIDKEMLAEWLKQTFDGVDTLVFFDFETYQYVLPKFKDLRPYVQMPFQWSAHVLDVKTGEIYHEEFLARKGKDPRRACAEKILTLPQTPGTRWVAYNMGFEKGVIGNLAKLYPDLEEDLLFIKESFVDLMIPFQNHYIYLPAFEGSYSIKYVLPGLFPNAKGLNYHNLNDIQNGTDAQRGYLELQTKKGVELQELKTNMLKYCGLDTWAMVMVYGYLLELKKRKFEIEDFGEERIAKKFKVV